MSTYDSNKDELIKLFELRQDKKSLLFSIFSYDKGKPKVGFTRSFEKKDGSIGYSNSGRLTVDEMIFLRDNIDEIIRIMQENFLNQ